MYVSLKTLEPKYLLLFDGYCNLCNSTVNRLLRFDRRKRITFVSLQSDAGMKLIAKYQLENLYDKTVILIANEKLYHHSTAIIHLFKILGGGWKILCALIVIPGPVRDFFYSLIARNRLKWFGRRESCRVPTRDELNHFIQ